MKSLRARIRASLAARLLALVLAGRLGLGHLAVAAEVNAAESAPWAGFVEPGFPFFSSVLDARGLGDGWPANNLTPRGLILNLGHDCWACFDVDLLRVAAVWRGAAVTPVSMSQGSYHTAGRKAPPGQGTLPQMAGTPWLANGLYPGVQGGEALNLTDPREPLADAGELGRGPLPVTLGRFKAVRLLEGGTWLEYEAAGSTVRERISARLADGQPVVERHVRLDAASQPRWLILGGSAKRLGADLRTLSGEPAIQLDRTAAGLLAVRVSPTTKPVEFIAAISESEQASGAFVEHLPERPSPARWPETIITRGELSTADAAYVIDPIPLPLTNPWHRNVRLADLGFLGDGRAAAVTFDGDVWLVSGLKDELREVRWKRFASGLHEPLSVVIRGGEVCVFDRNGIWRLEDTDGNGEADVHTLLSNQFAQTAETREFAASMRLSPDGSFIISKGGQQESHIGRDNGTVLRVPADGAPAEVLGWGLRMPFIGVHPETGVITASDQQGHYVPATPLHIISGRRYYGYLSTLLPKEKYPASIAEPLTWIPHPINASGMGQVWLAGARMGPLNGALLHLGYYRPELFVVPLNERGDHTQAAVMSLSRDFAFPLNAGAVNPADGQLYVTGFQIWGTDASQISGLARVRYTGRPFTLPVEVAAMKEGVLLRFDTPLDTQSATNVANYSAEHWNYRRTASYGSPHYRLDGTKGQDALTPSSAYLSRDGRSVFVGIPGLLVVMQMRLGWALRTADGSPIQHNAYFTPHELTPFFPEDEGFAPMTVDLNPRPATADEDTPVTAAEGQRVAALMGCVACHSADGSTLGKVGPSWKGLFGSERRLAGGGRVRGDEDYLREAIRDPAAKVVAGFDQSDTGMPSYEGTLSDAQIEALVLYLKTLR